MNIKKAITVGFMAVAASALALDYVEVIDVSARQRYPWNGLVDIDFELDSHATEPYMMKVTVFDNVGKTNLPVKCVVTPDISTTNNPCMVTKDTTRIVWDAAADLPDGFKSTNVLVTCQDTRCTPVDKLYCVIDLSAGSGASSFPVSYLDSIPAGGWTDDYKKTKLVFRRIDAGSFMMGSPASETGRQSNEDYHFVRLSKSYYISVFELTEKQYALIMGGSGSSKRSKLLPYTSIRGTDYVDDNYWNGKTSPYCWPIAQGVDPSSLLGKLRSKTSISTFNLPTEAQWEYAAKAETRTAVNIGGDCVDEVMNLAARYNGNCSDGKGDAAYTTWTEVGCYLPNAWGLYDMLGNAQEWVVDAWKEHLGTASVTDPIGNSTVKKVSTDGTSRVAVQRTVKGGGFFDKRISQYDKSNAALTQCRAAYRTVQWSVCGGDYAQEWHLNAVRLVFSAE